MAELVLTLIGNDKPGLVEAVAAEIAANHGSWQASRMAHLNNKFAGILSITVPDAHKAELVGALQNLSIKGLSVTVEDGETTPISDTMRQLKLNIVGHDRPGIIKEVSQALARESVNVIELSTDCAVAAMSSEPLFHAEAVLQVNQTFNEDVLRTHLEKISNDLIVDIHLQ